MERVLYEVKKVIVGQDHLLERMLVALLARGHILVEGVPGLAKTLAIKTLAQAIGGEFKRIQFTPDLVPADLVGTRIYNQKTGEFSTSLGPVFTNLLLADEINRAPAKVQSALLEVMQEHQVTIGRETHKVPDPFLVLATQNPIETEGTYPLPEAQVDRFMMKVLIDYPTDQEEFVIVERMTGTLLPVGTVLTTQQLVELAARGRQGLRRSGADGICGAARRGHAPARRVRPERHGALHPVRRQPARLDQPDPDGAGAGLPARPQLRAGAGRAGHGARRDAPPARPVVRGAVGQRHRDMILARVLDADPGAGRCRPLCRRTCLVAQPSTPERILQRLDWQVIRRLDGILQGDYRSLFYGFGLDLADLREYQPGDDIRYIDWNVTARLDTPYVRQYIEDREITAWFLLDLSPSVDFGTVNSLKRDCLIDFVTVLARLLTRHGNRVGAILYDSQVERVIPGARRPAARAAADQRPAEASRA